MYHYDFVSFHLVSIQKKNLLQNDLSSFSRAFFLSLSLFVCLFVCLCIMIYASHQSILLFYPTHRSIFSSVLYLSLCDESMYVFRISMYIYGFTYMNAWNGMEWDGMGWNGMNCWMCVIRYQEEALRYERHKSYTIIKLPDRGR